MRHSGRRLFNSLASSILLAASALVPAPAAAQSGGGDDDGSNMYCCTVVGCQYGGPYVPTNGPYGCCFYDGYRWQVWHPWGTEDCPYPPYGYERADRPSQESTQSPEE